MAKKYTYHELLMAVLEQPLIIAEKEHKEKNKQLDKNIKDKE